MCSRFSALVQAFNAVPAEIDRYSSRIENIFGLYRKEAFASGAFFGGLGFSGNVTLIALLTYGGSLVGSGELSIGQLMSEP